MQISSWLSFLPFPEQWGWVLELPAVILKPGGIKCGDAKHHPSTCRARGSCYPSPVNQVEGKKPSAVCPSLWACPPVRGVPCPCWPWKHCLRAVNLVPAWLITSQRPLLSCFLWKRNSRTWMTAAVEQGTGGAGPGPCLQKPLVSRHLPPDRRWRSSPASWLPSGRHSQGGGGDQCSLKGEESAGVGLQPGLKQGSLCCAPEVPRAHRSLLSLHK